MKLKAGDIFKDEFGYTWRIEEVLFQDEDCFSIMVDMNGGQHISTKWSTTFEEFDRGMQVLSPVLKEIYEV